MDTNKMRAEFESSPRFRGMDFTRSSTHPEFYESPYANGAWDGWKASREAVVVELPDAIVGARRYQHAEAAFAHKEGIDECRAAIEAQGLKVEVKP